MKKEVTHIDRAMRISEVSEAIGASRSTIYVWLSKGMFPKPRRLGVRRVGWLRSDIQKWLQSRPEAA